MLIYQTERTKFMKKWTNIRIHVTTHWGLYLSIFIISLLIIFFTAENESKNVVAKVMLNIGYGLLSSVTLAFMIDLVNTNITGERDKKEFDYFVQPIKNAIYNLIDEAVECSDNRHGNGWSKNTFNDWIGWIFEPNDSTEMDEDDYNDLINEIILKVIKIKEIASDLSEKSLFLNNPYCSSEFIERLSQLQRDAARIESSFNRKEYKRCNDYIIHTLSKRICLIFPEMTDSFTKKYNNDEDENNP